MEMEQVSSTTSQMEPVKIVKEDAAVSSTDPDEATRAFAMGKRDYAMRDYAGAVVNLAKACELFTAIHGELGDELGDVYYFYGRALFANARSESTVLGDQIDKNDDDDGEDEDEGDDAEEQEDNEEKVENDAKTENGEAEKVENGAKTENSEAEKVENGESKKSESNEAEKVENGESKKSESSEAEKVENGECKIVESSDAEKVENGDSKNNEAEKEGEEEEPTEADDLQLSWEILEMAKVIYQRKADDDKEIAAKLSEVYLTLGENGLESESYETAIQDIQSCLDLQRKCLKDDSRRIAETFYQLGMAYAMREDCDNAVENFNEAVKQLNKRMSNLELAKKEGKKMIDDEEHDSFYTIDHEMDEIKSVISELEEKITDVQDFKAHLKKEIAAKMGFGTDGASTSSASGSTNEEPKKEAKAVNVINHLVRKKRKNEDEDVAAGAEKKVKTDEAS